MDEQKDPIKTDMNDRERERFAKSLRSLSELATKAAAALDERNDTEFVLNLVILSMTGGSGMEEMIDVATSALRKKAAPDAVLDATEIL